MQVHEQEEGMDQGEVLTGAELYHYLLEENENKLGKAAAKLEEYAALQRTLENITEHCRRPVLAPVAGGLAYFEAEMDATNNLLVLLGDGWFAERSARQAAAIAQRRIDFLRREHKVLAEEKQTLLGRRDIFLSEVPDAAAAMEHVAGGATARPAAAAAAASQSDPTPATNSRVGDVGTGGGRAGGDAASAAAAPDDDAALATFDEQDELTEEELMALEAELADRIDDDAYVEAVITERMIAKKEKRVQAELLRRRQLAEGADAAVDGPHAAATVFRTPADILASFAPSTAAAATTEGAATEAAGETAAPGGAAAVDAAAGRLAKSVSFADAVDVRYADPFRAPAAAPVAPPRDTAPARRATYAVGDIVEHPPSSSSAAPVAAVPVAVAGVAVGRGEEVLRGMPALSPALPPGGGRRPGSGARKGRKSLFQREMEGDDDDNDGGDA